MTVKELIEALSKYPPEMDVAITYDGGFGITHDFDLRVHPEQQTLQHAMYDLPQEPELHLAG